MSIAKKAELFALQLLTEDLSMDFMYHNTNHTKRVVAYAEEIIEHTKDIDATSKDIILTAAWLHDIGYTVSVENHEDESIKMAESFLGQLNVAPSFTRGVINCIDATRVDAQPQDLNEQVIRDADAGHFASDQFKQYTELLRQELKLSGRCNYSVNEWLEINIQLMSQKHKYLTTYAVSEWAPKKEENLMALIKKQNKNTKKQKKEKTKAILKAKYKNENPERSIQTLFRVTLRNHIKLSDIADTKANILLSVNAIIISLALSNIIPKLDNPSNQHLMIPTLVLVVFSVASIILSIMSTKPNVTSGKFSKDDVKNRKVNILFFGNFHKMQFKDYHWGINEIINDKDYVYEALTKDLYYLGVVLERKYRLLRITYIVFLIGIIASVISFIVAFSLM